MFSRRECLSLFKSFAAQSFLLSFMPCDKNWLFLILYEKYWMSSCTTGWIRNSDTHKVPGYGPDWLDGIVVNHGQDSTNKPGSSFLIGTIRVRLLSCSTFVIIIGIIQFWNFLHCSKIDTQTPWKLCTGASSTNAKQHSMPFPNFWGSEIHHDAAFFTDCGQLTLVCMLKINILKWQQFTQCTIYTDREREREREREGWLPVTRLCDHLGNVYIG